MTAFAVLLAVLLLPLAFAAGAAFDRLRTEDDTAADTAELPARTGRPEFTGYHSPPSRFAAAAGHPPEPGQTPAH